MTDAWGGLGARAGVTDARLRDWDSWRVGEFAALVRTYLDPGWGGAACNRDRRLVEACVRALDDVELALHVARDRLRRAGDVDGGAP